MVPIWNFDPVKRSHHLLSGLPRRVLQSAGILILLLATGTGCDRLSRMPVPQGVAPEASYDRSRGLWNYTFPDGTVKTWYGDGKLAILGQKDQSGRTGQWESYAPGDRQVVTMRGEYQNDWRVGTWEFFDDAGVLYLTVDYALEPRRTFGFISTRDYGNENGPYIRYFPDGRVEEKGNFYSGYYEGAVIRYHKSGHMALQGQYSRDNRVGTWKIFYSDGTLEREENYQDGVLVGRLETHYPDGSLYYSALNRKGEGPTDVKLLENPDFNRAGHRGE